MSNKDKLSIEAIKANAPNVCFVAMDFSRKFRHVYEDVIEKAILDAGLTPVRSDQIVSAGGNVLTEILEIIRLCRMVVADVTGANPNVLIEVGIAHALGKILILLTQDATVPFDLQPRRITIYDLSDAGKIEARESLIVSLRSATSPSEELLQLMLHFEQPGRLLVLHGSASKSHTESVYPPISENYDKRLKSMSSETLGIWEIGLAYQKIAWSTGLEVIRPRAANAQTAPHDIVTNCNAFILGGPGANPFFARTMDLLQKNFFEIPSMKSAEVENNKKRFRIYLGNIVYPEDQDKWLLEENIDVGLIVRAPSPFSAKCTIWLVAGIRSFGTEAAVRALTTPSLLKTIGDKVRLDQYEDLIWAIVRAKIDEAEDEIIDVDVVAAGRCHRKGRAK